MPPIDIHFSTIFRFSDNTVSFIQAIGLSWPRTIFSAVLFGLELTCSLWGDKWKELSVNTCQNKLKNRRKRLFKVFIEGLEGNELILQILCIRHRRKAEDLEHKGAAL